MTINLNSQWRVVFDPLQWILQHRHGDRWRNRSFCVSRSSLLRCIREYCCEPIDISEVLKLPDWHPDRVRAAAPKASTLTDIPREGASRLLAVSEAAEGVLP